MNLKRWMTLLCSVALLAACGGDDGNGGGEEPKPEPTPTPTPNPEPTPTPAPEYFSNDFMRGGTMSFAQYLTDKGLKYREGGVEKDPYASMKEHGANVVRLQLNLEAYPTYEGKTIDWADWSRVVADCKKAYANKMDVLLTLKPDADAYTTSSTHHNLLPAAWTGLSETEIGDKLYAWVYDALEKLAKEGIYPRAVAVGNEVNVGFLRPSSSAASDGARTGRLLKRGFEAVRAYGAKYNPNVKTILHIANPAKVLSYGNQIVQEGGSDFDIVGVSWYPGYDHSMGGFADFGQLAARIKEYYGASLMILETAASFTTGTVGGEWKGDNCSNAYNWPKWATDAENAVNYTPKKQREWLAALAAEVKTAGGAGVITWGTESLPDSANIGFYTYPAAWANGSTWENNSYWDFTNQNNLHEGIDWMRDVQ